MIQTIGVSKKYGELEVLKNIDVTIESEKITSIIGASGAGKSTLLQIIGTLDKANSGSIIIENTNVSKLSAKDLSKFRNQHIGFVFQFHHLLPEFTALENILIPGYIAGKSKKELLYRAEELLTYLKMDKRASHKPSELSGGEQQRIAIARALINQPKLILADEPSGNLDSNTADELHQLFIDLKNNFKSTFIIVTHNPSLAKLSDTVIEMKDGQILRKD
jgi:lipoprotein-releasing system ATP-binding protein